MAIILPRVEKRPEYGFLSGLSNSLSQGLAGAAQSQFDQFQQRRQQEAKRESLRKLGVPESLSELVMNLSPAEQFEVVGNYLQGRPEQSESGQEMLNVPGTALIPQQQQQNQVSDILSALGGPQQAGGLETLLSPEQRRQMRFQQQFGQPQKAEAVQVQPQQAQQLQQQPKQAPRVATKETDKQAEEFFKSIARSRGQLKPAEIAKLMAQERKESVKEQALAQKETLPYYKEVKGKYKAAKQSDIRLNRMEELIKKGNLSFPLTSSLVKAATKGVFGLGLDLSSLLTADTQEFDKLSTDFLKDAKAIFGSRITDVDLQNFLRTVPTSTQSTEGKKQVIRNLKIFNAAAEAEAKAMEDVIRENGGKRPVNLEQLVEEKTNNRLNKLAEKFKSGASL